METLNTETQGTEPQQSTQPTRPIWLIILTVSLPMFMASLDNLIVTNALPVIGRELGATFEQLSWFVNAYTLAFASLVLTSSGVADRCGRRCIFAGGLTLFTVASLLCGLSTEPWMLIAARTLQGVGAAALFPLSLTLLSTSVPERLRPAVIGIWGGISGLGVALGPLIGGIVVEGVNWEAAFWINVPVGIACLALIYWVIPESYGKAQKLDLLGVILAVIGVFALTYGISRGNDKGWTSTEILASIISGSVFLLVFLIWETRTSHPVLPLSMFKNSSFSIANAVSFLFTFGTFGAVFLLSQFLQVVLGNNPLEAGVMTMPWTLAPLFVAPISGWLAGRIGNRPVIFVGLILLASGLTWIAAILAPDMSYRSMIPAMIIAGVGMGLVFSPIVNAVLVGMASEEQATASGTNATIREVGVVFGVAGLTAIFLAYDGQLTPTAFTDAAIPAIFFGAAAVGISALMTLRLPS